MKNPTMTATIVSTKVGQMRVTMPAARVMIAGTRVSALPRRERRSHTPPTKMSPKPSMYTITELVKSLKIAAMSPAMMRMTPTTMAATPRCITRVLTPADTNVNPMMKARRLTGAQGNATRPTAAMSARIPAMSAVHQGNLTTRMCMSPVARNSFMLVSYLV